MEPRVQLEQQELAPGLQFSLHRHDGNLQLSLNGDVLADRRTSHVEAALPKATLSPFRPVRRPCILLAGLGLGVTTNSVLSLLTQEKAEICVAEPFPKLTEWLRRHRDAEFLDDSRLRIVPKDLADVLTEYNDSLHALLLYENTAMDHEGNSLQENLSWIPAACNALKRGGLLAFALNRKNSRLEKALRNAGLELAQSELLSSPHAKRPRRLPLLLARKGAYHR